MPSVIGAIREKWVALGGPQSFLGEPTTDELGTPDGVGRFNHFQGGSIYWTPATGAHEIHGAIVGKWASLGFERSFLGYPTTDEMDFPEGGRVSVFERGAIYWWPDTGAIELNDVVVHFTGINCFGETDELSSSDEPYAVIGVNFPGGTGSFRSRVFEDVDSGDTRPDLIEVYRGKPRGITLSTLLMENDEGDPDKYKAAMQSAVGSAAAGVTALTALIPAVGPVIAGVVGPLLAAVTPTIGAELNRLLGTDDDRIGDAVLGLSAKQMVVLAARTGNSTERNIGFKVATPLLSGDGGSYKAYFGLVPS